MLLSCSSLFFVGCPIASSSFSKIKLGNSKSVILFNGSTFCNWEKTEFADPGNVYFAEDKYVLEKGHNLTGITWNGPLFRLNYEISLQAMLIDGYDFFCGLTFPVGQDYCTLIVGGWGGSVVGLSNIDNHDASSNETLRYMHFKKGIWYDIQIQVTPKRIQAWINHQSVIDIDIRNRELSVKFSVEKSKPLGIATWQTTGAVRNIIMEKIQ